MEWLVAALTVVFGIISIALWINYCSVGESERQNSKGDINAKRSTTVRAKAYSRSYPGGPLKPD
jgi:hypothetical protein